ncbi:NADPH-Fe(3+) oxidoreductase subunit beta [subsurface metagenome]
MGPTFSFGEVESPCQIACPAHLSIPGYVALVAKGKFKEALDLIRERMPLPSVCGRVCLAPCETECRRQEVEQPIAIEALKRFVTEYVVDELPSPVPRTKPEKVAIVGSGPAGLAAAYDLIRKGYGVTIYEASPVIGGWLAMGIPQYRLPKKILKRDIDYIKALGVEIKVNTPLGQGLTLDDLASQGYEATLLAMGAQRGQRLKIPGADLDGTLVATSFMRDFNLGKKVKVGKRVLVIGGGSVAVDCARTTLRLGAAEVHIAYLECREDMPAAASELAEAEEESITIHPSLTISRILGEGGRVTGVECLRLRGVEFDEDGQPRVDIIKGTEHILSADMVIFAVGQTPDLSNVAGDGVVETTRRGTIAVDSETMTTSRPGIFAAGDVVRGPTNVIEAIADGQKAAFYIDYYLQKSVQKVDKVELKAPDIKVKIPTDVEKQERQRMPSLPVPERVSNFAEVALGFSPKMAIAEAKRCLNCAGHLCKDVCPYDAPQFPTNGDIRIVKCNLCLDRLSQSKAPACVATCPTEALDVGPMEELIAEYGELREIEDFADYRQTSPSIVFRAKSLKK